MAAWSTTRLSSKGQVVIPRNIREDMGLQEGSQLMVASQGGAVILKPFLAPSMKQFDSIIKKLRVQARKAGLTKKDIEKAIAKARRRP